MTIDERLTLIADELIDGRITLEQAEDAFRRKLIDRSLHRAKNNRTKAARMLGIHRNTMHNMIRLFNFEKSAWRARRLAK